MFLFFRLDSTHQEIVQRTALGLLAVAMFVAVCNSTNAQTQDLQSTTSIVEGVVSNPDGSLAVDADVYLHKSYKEFRRVKTDANGRFRLDDVADSAYTLWAETNTSTSLKGYLQGTKIQTHAAEKTEYSENLQLAPGCAFNIRVVKEDGRQPIAQAEVSLASQIPRRYMTDELGIVKLGGLVSDDWYFVAKAPGFAQSYQKVPRTEPGSVFDLELRLQPGSTLVGRIHDESGKPVPGAMVSARDSTLSFHPAMDKGITGADGRFSIELLPRNVPLEIHVRENDHQPQSKLIAIPSDTERLEQDFELTSRSHGTNCIVHVVDPYGNPIPNATIENIGNPSAEHRRARSNEAGDAQLIAPHSYDGGVWVTIRAKGFVAKQVDLSAGDSQVPVSRSVELEQGHFIRGRLRSPDEKPLENVTVVANGGPRRTPAVPDRTETDADGNFSFDTLPEPSSFTFYTPHRYARIEDLVLPVDSDETIIVDAEPENVIRVIAVDATTNKRIPQFNVRIDAPKKGLLLRALTIDTELKEKGTEVFPEQSEFRLGHLARNTAYQLIVSAEGYFTKIIDRLEAQVVEESQVLEVELQPEQDVEYLTVIGKVLDSRQDPVEGAMVYLLVGTGKAIPANHFNKDMFVKRQVMQDKKAIQLLSVTTNKDGKFRMEKVKQGDWCQILVTGDGIVDGQFLLKSMSEDKPANIEIHVQRSSE